MFIDIDVYKYYEKLYITFIVFSNMTGNIFH